MRRNIIFYYSIATMLIVSFVFAPTSANAASCPVNQKGELVVVTRNGSGGLVKNMKWELYKQAYDADNSPILGKLVGSSNTGDAAMSSIKFDPLAITCTGVACDNKFVVKIYDVNRDAGEFYIWNNKVDCGDVRSVETRLSNIKVIIRDRNKTPLKNRVFELYTQKRDAAEKPIINETVSKTLNTGETGEKIIYVSSGAYIIKIPAIDNKFIYTNPDIMVAGAAETEFDYTLSNVTVSIRDGSGKLLVNIPFNVYKQEHDADGKFIIGELVSSYNTGQDGVMGIFLPTGNYAFRFNGAGGEFYYLWNQEIIETKSYIIDYRLSNVNVIVRDAKGKLLPKSYFDVYKQKVDADGKFIVGEHIGRFNTGDTGIAGVFLPTGNYAFRFEGTALQYQYLWNQFIGVSGSPIINFILSTLKVVVIGTDNVLLKNIPITVYKQKFDEFQKPILGDKITTINSQDQGSAIFYLPPGLYAIVIKSPDNKDFTLLGKEVGESGLTEIEYILSALDIVVKNGNNEIVKNSVVEVYEQAYDAQNHVLLGKLVGSKSTLNAGRVILYYPPGTYAIKIKGTQGQDYFIWETIVTELKPKKVHVFLSMLRVVVRDGAKNPIKGAKALVATQKEDFSGKSVIDKNITYITTSDAGFGDVYLPSGRYAVVIGTEKKFDIKVIDYLMTVVEIEKTDVTAFTIKVVRVPSPIGNRKDGTLFKLSQSPAVYVIKKGEKRLITSADVFKLLGYSWKNVITITAMESELYPEGTPLTFDDARRPDGTVIKTAKDKTVYLIDNGKKRSFVSAQVFEALGYKWQRVITISEWEFSNYPLGESVTYNKIQDGNLIKSQASPAVYFIENGFKRLIPSARLFLVRGYKWKDVLIASDEDTKLLPDADPLGFEFTDEDQDGLNYEEEVLFGTDPAIDDTDLDGYLDGEEVRNGYNPLGTGKLK